MSIIRKPIILDKNTIALIQVFKRGDSLADLWIHDIEKHEEEEWMLYLDSARQFLDQLENNWTPRFLMELMKACYERLYRADQRDIERKVFENPQQADRSYRSIVELIGYANQISKSNPINELLDSIIEWAGEDPTVTEMNYNIPDFVSLAKSIKESLEKKNI
jgi:hypothetical protein